MTLAALADPIQRSVVGRLARGTATVSELVECFSPFAPIWINEMVKRQG